jgi:hypothetical protein
MPNKSLDRSGGCAFCIIMVRRGLNEIVPPGQLNRWASLDIHETPLRSGIPLLGALWQHVCTGFCSNQ